MYVAKIYGFRIFGKKGSKYDGMLPYNKSQDEEANKYNYSSIMVKLLYLK